MDRRNTSSVVYKALDKYREEFFNDEQSRREYLRLIDQLNDIECFDNPQHARSRMLDAAQLASRGLYEIAVNHLRSI